jgi:hypothetical protein
MNNLVSVFIAVSEYISPYSSESLLIRFFSFFDVRPDLINLDTIQMKLIQIVFSNLFAMTSRQIKPIADSILVMTCGPCYSTNAPFFGKQCQGSNNFLPWSGQSEKWCPSILTKTMSAGLTSKKSHVILAISLFKDDIPCTLLPVIRTSFVPAPEY